VLAQLNDVSKSFGSQAVLRDVSFQINPSEKIGLIGANGAGKTTLLTVISGVADIDAGTVRRKSNLQVGTLDQIPDFHEGTSVIEEGLRSFEYLRTAESEMRRLEHDIASGCGKETMDRYSLLQHEFELKGGYTYKARTEAALLGVGFSREALQRRSNTLSGGEKNRLALARLLLSDAELLLLDEPTNHLDIRSIEWLEKFLLETEKTVIVVSHDRFFLDRVVQRILEVVDGRVDDYRGNYSAYLKERSDRIARLEKEYQLQSEWIREQEDYIRRNIAGQKTKQAQSRRKLLARVKPIERPRTASTSVRFRFLPMERSGRNVLRTRNLSVGYPDRVLVQSFQFEVQRAERWAILGSNGSGKTTLLRTLTGALSPLDGDLEWNEGLEVGYYDQQLQDLNHKASVLDEIRALDNTATDGELRGYLAQFLFSGEDVLKRVGTLSGGEKSRLMLARIIYAAPQLLALDEPTNHLDIASREALETALAAYPGTILFVTHDRYLVQKIATHLLYLEGGRAHTFDRLSAFEEWLSSEPEATRQETTSDASGSLKPAGGLSKNKRDRLQREIIDIEDRIASVEVELAELEKSFQRPDSAMDWESTHRRYAELKQNLETLYLDLASRWELMG
jgi:ATP-binding cassette subfamily F protein 3